MSGKILVGGIVLLFFGATLGTGQDKKPEPKSVKDKIKEIAGSAEFLRDVPKHFAILKSIDQRRNQVTLLIDGEVLPKVWSLVPDAEIKVMGWWGRLDQFTVGDRVWVWFKTDRKKHAVAISMIADEPSEQDIHGEGLTVERVTAGSKGDGPPSQMWVKGAGAKGKSRVIDIGRMTVQPGGQVYVQSTQKAARLVLTPEEFEKRRAEQKNKLRDRWVKE